MPKIAVFDSGFGSLSIIRPVQRATKSHIIYFADQKNFPYGKKTKTQLAKIIQDTINMLKKKFRPDLIIVGSNTPTLLLQRVDTTRIIGVWPPLKKAVAISKTSSIAILATQSVVKSRELTHYIQNQQLPKKIKIKKINVSPLVELVESAKFATKPQVCKQIIKETLGNFFTKKNNVDVATLSSTHLQFLIPLLKEEFPNVTFLDPATQVANKVARIVLPNGSKRNTLRIFTSGDPKLFQNNLYKLGIIIKHKKVNYLSAV